MDNLEIVILLAVIIIKSNNDASNVCRNVLRSCYPTVKLPRLHFIANQTCNTMVTMVTVLLLANTE